MGTRVYILILSAWFLACATPLGERYRPPPQHLKNTDGGHEPGLRIRMAAISKALEYQGFNPMEWSKEGWIEAGTSTVVDLDVKKKERVALVAIGDKPDLALDIVVHNQSNVFVSGDLTPDVRAALAWIPDPEEFFSVQLSAQNKSGRFLIQAFSAPTSTSPPRLNGLFDADPLRTPSFETVKYRTSFLGYQPLLKPKQKQTIRGDRFVFPVQLTRDRCYMFVAQGSKGIDRLGLRLEEDRSLIVTDLSDRPEAWISHCSDQNKEARLILNVRAGSGTVTVGSFDIHRKKIQKRVGPPLLSVNPSLKLEEQEGSLEQQFNDKKYSEKETLLKREVAAGDRATAVFSLQKGECAALYSVTSPSLKDTDLMVFADEKRIDTTNRILDARTLVGVCARTKQTYRVELIALKGQGQVRTLLKRLPQSNLPDLPDPTTQFLAQEAAALYSHSGMAPPKTVTIMKKGNNPHLFSTRITLKSNKCYGLAVIASIPIETAIIRDDSGKEVGAWSGPGTPALLAICPRQDEIHKIEVSTDNAKEKTPYLLIFHSDIN